MPEWTFDSVAELYERMRPGYPEELYDTLFTYQPLNRDCRALEVGTGGGEATLPVLETGCEVTAVEPGPRFSALCREEFRAFPGFSVRTEKFEEAELGEGAYDLVFSATAFHWIPEELGYRKVYRILKPGGVFARFQNHPYMDKGRPALAREIQELYASYMGSAAPPI